MPDQYLTKDNKWYRLDPSTNVATRVDSLPIHTPFSLGGNEYVYDGKEAMRIRTTPLDPRKTQMKEQILANFDKPPSIGALPSPNLGLFAQGLYNIPSSAKQNLEGILSLPQSISDLIGTARTIGSQVSTGASQGGGYGALAALGNTGLQFGKSMVDAYNPFTEEGLQNKIANDPVGLALDFMGTKTGSGITKDLAKGAKNLTLSAFARGITAADAPLYRYLKSKGIDATPAMMAKNQSAEALAALSKEAPANIEMLDKGLTRGITDEIVGNAPRNPYNPNITPGMTQTEAGRELRSYATRSFKEETKYLSDTRKGFRKELISAGLPPEIVDAHLDKYISGEFRVTKNPNPLAHDSTSLFKDAVDTYTANINPDFATNVIDYRKDLNRFNKVKSLRSTKSLLAGPDEYAVQRGLPEQVPPKGVKFDSNASVDNAVNESLKKGQTQSFANLMSSVSMASATRAAEGKKLVGQALSRAWLEAGNLGKTLDSKALGDFLRAHKDKFKLAYDSSVNAAHEQLVKLMEIREKVLSPEQAAAQFSGGLQVGGTMAAAGALGALKGRLIYGGVKLSEMMFNKYGLASLLADRESAWLINKLALAPKTSKDIPGIMNRLAKTAGRLNIPFRITHPDGKQEWIGKESTEE